MLEDDLGVLSSTAEVVRHAQFVTIDRRRVGELAARLADAHFTPPAWDAESHFADGSPRTANYVLVLDALNFCFWGEPRWQVHEGGQTLDGYRALAAALKRAIAEGVPLLEANYLAHMTQPDLQYLLRGEGEIPLLGQRLANLREVGTALGAKYSGWFSKAIEASDRSAVQLVAQIVADFPSFNDVARYHNREVRFYKRAQICVADLYGAFGGRQWGNFVDLDDLSAFADYKVPQILRHYGVLVYAPDLAARVDLLAPLPAGSAEEIEIRAATIWAVEYLREDVARQGQNARAFELDWHLWNLNQSAGGMAPYHRTRTVFY